MREVCLMILCGIPGVGKSTLCRYLNTDERFSSIYDIFNVEYDKLLPSNSTQPREDRRILVKVVNRIIFDLQRNNFTIGDLNAENITEPARLTDDNERSNVPVDSDGRLANSPTEENALCANIMAALLRELSRLSTSSSSSSSKPVIVIIDDNMYYTSMRHAYYRIAWRQACCYLCVHVQVELSVALERNSARPVNQRQEENTVRNMYASMEPPPSSFERYYLVLDGAVDYDRFTVDVLLDSVRCSLAIPTPRPSTPYVKGEPLPETLGLRCDLIVRRLIAARIKESIEAENEDKRVRSEGGGDSVSETSGSSNTLWPIGIMDKEARRKFSRKLATRKSRLLKSIKTGKFSDLDTMSPGELFEFLDSHLVSYLHDF